MNFRSTFARIDKVLTNVLGDKADLDVGGDGVTVLHIVGEFDAQWIEPNIGALRTEILEPRFIVDEADVLGVVVEGTTTLTPEHDGNVYTVIDQKPDSTGKTVLILRPQ